MINIDDFIYKSFGIKSSEYLITKDFRLIIFCENEYVPVVNSNLLHVVVPIPEIGVDIEMSDIPELAKE